MTNTLSIFADSTNYSFSATDLLLRGVTSLKKLPVLNNKSQLNNIIIRKNNTPDHLAINLYWDTFRSWYNPNKIYSDEGNVSLIPKLKTKGIYLDYTKLSKIHGVSKEIIRQKIVKLENLGLINRSFQHKETVTTKSFNRLIIYVWQQTVHFFNTCGVDRGEVGELTPQTNHQYVAEKHNIKFNCNALLSKAEEGEGVSNQLRDTKELNKPFSLEKDRSMKSNFCKNSFLKKEEGGFRSQTKIVPTSKQCKTLTLELKDFYPLTYEDVKNLQNLSGREFSLNAMNEILLDMSKRVKDRWFKSKKGFLSYMTKVFAYEKRDACRINNEGFRIRSNKTVKEITIQRQEEFLSQIEYSRHVSPEWHFRKKLCAVLEREKAYNLLNNYKYSRLRGNIFEIHLTRSIELTDIDKNIILQQAKASHEIYDLASDNHVILTSLKIIAPTSPPTNPKSTQTEGQGAVLIQADIWGQVRQALIDHYGKEGEALDRSWFSKLEPEVDGQAKEIKLKAPTQFFRDWINNNYRQILDILISRHQYSYEIC